MCGLVGCFGFLGQSEREAFRNLLVMDYVRGTNSTGIALVNSHDFKTYILKDVGHPFNLFEQYDIFDDADNIINGVNWRVIMGHNRAATRGKLTPENAHPFEHGDWIGAHNGTLTTVFGLEKGNEFDVDSEAIIYTLSQKGLAETIKKINGAYALSLYNKAEKKLYLTRNDERTLYYAMTDDEQAIFWSSDSVILRTACAYARVKIKEPTMVPKLHVMCMDVDSVGKKTITDLGEFKDYKSTPFRYGSGTNSSTARSDGENLFNRPHYKNPSVRGPRRNGFANEHIIALAKQYEGKEVDFAFVREHKIGAVSYLECASFDPDSDDNGFEIRIFQNKDFDKIKSKAGTWKGKVKKFIFLHDMWTEGDVIYALMDNRTIVPGNLTYQPIPFVKSKDLEYKGYLGEIITQDEWEERTKNHCANCMQDADPHHPNEIHWIEPDEFLCKHCASSEEVLYFFGDLSNASRSIKGLH